MPQRILDVIPENPEVKHVSEEMEKPAMNEHGRKDGEGERNSREFTEDLSMENLIRSRAPFKYEILAFNGIQRHLVIENEPIGQDQSDGEQGKS